MDKQTVSYSMTTVHSKRLQPILVISIILSSAILIVPLTNDNAFAVKDKPHLFNPHLSKYLGAKWWEWALEIPAPIHPLIDANPCDVDQRGLFFFLGGVFAPVDTTSTSVTSDSIDGFQTRDSIHSSETSIASDTSDHVERTCTVPKGKAIFFPVFNVFSTFGDPDSPNLRDAIKFVKGYIDQATNLKASVDGTNINVNKLRSLTIPFEFTLPPDNIFGITDPSALGPYKAIADGYWVALKPLSVGNHEISFSASHPDGTNIDVTYHITVQ
jgi:hypothetical protein